MQFNTLADILKRRSDQDKSGITFISGTNQEEFLSYKALFHHATKALAVLQNAGLEKGDELMFQVDDMKTFVISFWACILGGVIPVPLSTDNSYDHRNKLFNIWPVLKSPFLLIEDNDFVKIKNFAESNGVVETYLEMADRIIHPRTLSLSDENGRIENIQAEDTAFIQFSSGSTGSPKGVILSHRNLLYNVDAIATASGYSKQDSLLSWMPLTHDMGLIGFHISPLYSGLNHFIIPTSLFIRRPSLWLDAISNHRVTVTCSPNFGYEYTLKRLNSDENQNWDFSAIRLIYNGAEPVSEKISRRFLAQFENYGLSSLAICPVYGLAEASLAVSISRIEDPVLSLKISRRKNNIGEKVLILTAGNEGVSIVNLGTAVPNCAISILDRQAKQLPDETIGLVYIKGESVTSGYYNNTEQTNKTISSDGWLNTGDLGFLKDGCLFITGRDKDVFFVNGQNYYPNDLEGIAGELGEIELNKIAIAGAYNHDIEQEEVIAFVVHKGSLHNFLKTSGILRNYLNAKTGISLKSVIPVKNIPRTTSGKIQRFKLLEAYQNNEFQSVVAEIEEIEKQAASAVDLMLEQLSPIEKQVFEIWQQVLPGRKPDPAYSFFENGGNSLKVTEMQMSILKKWNIDLSIRLLYEEPTLAGIAKNIRSGPVKNYQPVKGNTYRINQPVGALQRRLYYHWALTPESINYNIPVAMFLEGLPDFSLLADQLRALVLRHDSLRTTFVFDQEPKFVVHHELDVQLEILKMGEKAGEFNMALHVQPFNLETGPLFRFKIFSIRPDLHILFLDFHHIIADGISVHLFLQELLRLYQGKALPSSGIQYADFLNWEAEKLKGNEIAVQKKYWQEKIAEEWPVLELPADHSRPVYFDGKGERIFFQIETGERKKIALLAQKQGCSIHVLLFTIYKILLFKYTGQHNMVIGIPVAVRDHPDLQSLFGMFVNNLAVKQELDGGATFIEVLKSEAENMNEALLNKDFPFDELVEMYKGPRDPARNPLFDTMFVFQNMLDVFPSSDDFSTKPCFFDPGTTKFDISMEIFDDGDTFNGNIEFSKSLFERERILVMVSHFKQLMETILNDPEKRICDLSYLSHQEHFYQLDTFNDTTAIYPDKKTIQQLIREQAIKTPDHLALIFGNKQVTYQELEIQSDHLARNLQKAGVKAGGIVAIYLKRSPELIYSILAVLKSGATYLPIDFELPPGRIELILNDSRCDFIISSSSSVSGLKSLTDARKITARVIDVDDSDLAENPAGHFSGNKKPADIAYIIYTSGTTGSPKGVMISQQSLVNYSVWAAKTYTSSAKEAFPFFTSVSFDLTITSIFVPLITGNTIVIYEEHEMAIETILRENKVSTIKLTPSHLKIVARLPLMHSLSGSKIKRFIVGGEKLERWLAQEIYTLFHGKVEILNEYGPTEATVGCMIHAFDPKDQSAVVSIGKPADNMQIYVLDQYLSMVPIGVTGEIYIAGDGLATGYLFNEQATVKSFINHPFAEGKRMYKSGDKAKFLPDGTIEYIGRFDDQVKINGYRIELAEIELNLRQYPGIIEALLQVKINKHQVPVILAYYTSDTVIDPDDLISALSERLPHYMLPAEYFRIPKIPLTKNQKIDYSSLPVEHPSAPSIKKDKPQGKIQMIIEGVWKEILEYEGAGADINFFELGGDSIKAAQISSRLLAKGVRVSARDILTWHTLERVSAHAKEIDISLATHQGPVEGSIQPSPIAAWFFHQKFKHAGFYNQTLLFEFLRTPDTALLDKAFTMLLQHHDGLRLNYDAGRNEFFYNPLHQKATFKVQTFSEIFSGGPEELVGFYAAEAWNQFNLEKDCLLRGALFNSNDRHFLFIRAHHLVIDGMSWRILLEDLYQVYTALESGRIPVLPLKTDSLTAWQNDRLQICNSASFLGYVAKWEEIDRARENTLGTDQPKKQSVGRPFKVHSLAASIDMSFLLRTASHIFKFDPALLLYAAFLESMQQMKGKDTFLVTHESHGRHTRDFNFSRTIGWFTAMYPGLWEWKGKDLLTKIHYLKEQMEAYNDACAYYGIWKYGCHKQDDLVNDIPDFRFNYLGEFGSELSNDLFQYSMESPLLETHHENHCTAGVDINAMVVGKKLWLEISYSHESVFAGAGELLLRSWTENLEKIITTLKNTTSFTQPEEFMSVDLDENEMDRLFNS
ncbi:non-ribosomal peptide synthetase [Pedobacter steynii]|uniref:Carrier domain-containing protein n=1 Tax=Pedobacter steynii TaxID=430522 RepID=A0A1D7QNB7_9SPHI|nr:non-ribosomal peptide synthetase [Pedobacter steynii]AOM80166.1 hypothetical protein BFS30_25195 [Pedobacter steynii]